MAFINLARLTELPPGSAAHIELSAIDRDFENRAVALCNIGGVIHAIDGICPHAWGPLGHGALLVTTLICPFHAWGFDCTTGQCDADDQLRLATYPVKIEDGQIWVDVG